MQRSALVFSFVARQTKKQKGYEFLISSCGAAAQKKKWHTTLSPKYHLYVEIERVCWWMV
jgi:hypothetical protein